MTKPKSLPKIIKFGFYDYTYNDSSKFLISFNY